MLVNFSIENFRSIKDKITLSFEASNSKKLEDYFIINPTKNVRLLKLGLIYGANASGKTTILEGLEFLRDLALDPLEKKNEVLKYAPFLFDENTSKSDSKFAIEFYQNEVKYLYTLAVNKSFVTSESLYFHKPNKALVFKRATDISKQLTKIEFGSKININNASKTTLEANTLWNNTVLGGYIKTNFESLELKECIDWFNEKLKPIISPKTSLYSYISNKLDDGSINKKNVIEFLKRADFNISDIISKKGKIEVDEELLNKIPSLKDKVIINGEKLKELETREIFFRHSVNNNDFLLPYENESQGTQRYYQFSGLLSLMIADKLIILIDELEASLHPELLKHFILTFLANTKNSQLLATTHHRELLMEKDILRNDAIWFTEKNKDDATNLFSLDDFDSSVIKDGSSVFNAYKTGKLGAIPRLNDYYIELENGKEG